MRNSLHESNFKIQVSFNPFYSRQRPYHVENTGSRPITEVKQHRALLVLRWVTAWERSVPLAFFYSFFFNSAAVSAFFYKYWTHFIIWTEKFRSIKKNAKFHNF
jgi:hypothetical protein